MTTPLDLQPTLSASGISLTPLSAEDYEGLYAIASDPLLWEQHPDNQRYIETVFRDHFFKGAVDSGSALTFREADSGRIIGSSRYYEYDPDDSSIGIGYTFIARDHWGTTTNAIVKELMLKHIYQWVDAVLFHIGSENHRSRKAVEKLGGILVNEEPSETRGIEYIEVTYRLSKDDYL